MIVTDEQYFEIIRIEDIPELIKNIPDRICFGEGILNKRSIILTDDIYVERINNNYKFKFEYQ